MLDARRLKRSFSFAIGGVYRVFKNEQNFRIQVIVGLAVFCIMFVFGLSWLERAILTLAMALVLVLELMNSIFERVVDLLKPRVHEHVREVKDVMAGTVLIAAASAALVGAFIIGPYLFN